MLGAAAGYVAVLLIAGTLVAVLAGRVAMNRVLYDPWTNLAGLAAYAALVAGTLWAARPAGGAWAIGLRLPARPGRAFALAGGVLVTGLVAAAALEPLLHGAKS
ncbi:MAG: hypothetical protein QOH15_2042, partial [Gaiellales bacterium]|nr:hypothetical protein [Gaiellales bacterium]